jgi:hypothetical protein
MKDPNGPVSGATDPITSAELQREAECADSGRQDEAPAIGGDTHLPASEGAALEGMGLGARGNTPRPSRITSLPPD